MCQLISVPRKIGTKGTEPGREIFTAAHLEKWCYSYLGYQKISKDSVGKVQKLMEIWDKSSTSRLMIKDHHFEDCFLSRNAAGQLKLSHLHHADLCQAHQDSGQDKSHANEAWPVPSAKPNMFNTLARSRHAGGLLVRVRSAPDMLSRGSATPSSAQPPTPSTTPRTDGAQNPAPSVTRRAPSPPMDIPDPAYLSSTEKRGWAAMLAPGGPLDSTSRKQVRKTPSWPRSWANFSLSYLYSHRNA
jgi:hypothetical protein